MVNKQTDGAAEKKKSGLLDRIKLKSSYDCVLDAFRKYLNLAGYERGGLVYPSPDGVPVFLFASGFDLTTVYRFAPALEQLTDPETTGSLWFRFEAPSLDLFSACFSSHELDSLVAIETHPVCLDEITAVMVLAESLLDINRAKKNLNSLSADFETLSEQLTNNRHLLVSLSRVASVNQSREALINHTRSAVDSGKKATMVRISFGKIIESPEEMPYDTDIIPVYSAIMHQIARQIGSANLVHVRPDFSANIVIFSSSPVDTALYFHQLLTPLETVFGIQRISHIRVSDVGMSAEIREITDFILGEN